MIHHNSTVTHSFSLSFLTSLSYIVILNELLGEEESLHWVRGFAL